MNSYLPCLHKPKIVGLDTYIFFNCKYSTGTVCTNVQADNSELAAVAPYSQQAEDPWDETQTVDSVKTHNRQDTHRVIVSQEISSL